MNATIPTLKEALNQRATCFNEFYPRYLPDKEPKVLYDAIRHLPEGGGKRLRPVISMIAAEALTDSSDLVMPFASALEIMHSFTLAHDDIMDHSELRRGRPTIHTKYSEPTALLAGDGLFALSFTCLLDLDVPSSVYKYIQQEFVNCILDICEGQQEDMDFEDQRIINEDEYLQMIRKKTAVLFALAARGAALIVGASPEYTRALDTYGMSLGLAFQIWDDYLDMSSTSEALGKDIGNDIRNGKKTLIAVHALLHASNEDREHLSRHFGNRDATDEDVASVRAIFERAGSIMYARDVALSYNAKAKEALHVLPETEAKQILAELADYSIQREH